jgi:hypothetical protein
MKYTTDRARLQDAYRTVFNTPQGQLVLRHLAKRCNLTSTSVVKGDVHETYVNEGMRRVVLSILRQLKRDDAALLGLIEEGMDEEMNHG